MLAALGGSNQARWSAAGEHNWTNAWALDVGGGRYFVKTAAAHRAAMLEAECDGLAALAATGAIGVPHVHACGGMDETAYLVLDWIELHGTGGSAQLGLALADLHRAPVPCGSNGERFGYARDNFIGATPQRNGWSDDWAAFFRDSRLAPQLDLAARNGFGAKLARDGERLLAALPALFGNYDPPPSLLHGDLWSGNAGTRVSGEPVIFDPATYVGDRETDLAMTELFGGFGAGFHAAYRSAWPLAPGYAQRREVYNLYHLLNHLNLFGAGYLPRSRNTIAALLEQAA